MMRSLLFTLFAAFALAGAHANALADEDSGERLGGTIEARLDDGTRVHFPTLASDYRVSIQGDLAEVTLVQRFVNPLDVPVHADYLFPLNHDAAVHAMRMQVGDELIEARIQRKKEARETFEQAKEEGKAAALLEQHRPNMFTQRIANLMPGLPIEVTIDYAQTIPRRDGDYELLVPLVVGPRFNPPSIAASSEDGDVPRPARYGAWDVAPPPAYPPVSGLHIPDVIEKDRVSLEIRLDGGMPIQSVRSDRHALKIEEDGETRRLIGLAAGRTIDNADFVMRYRLAGDAVQAGLLATHDERGGFFSLLIEPPEAPAESMIRPREMVFVLDCSGSMAGWPMKASKAYMRHALKHLRPTDSFRVIRFSDAATEFSTTPLPATPKNIRRGIDYVRGLRGSGGTMMSSGVRQALNAPLAPGQLRVVTFLTDGYIGNDYEIIEMVRDRVGDARLFALGVGTATNRLLLDEMALAGRGFARYLDPTAEDVDEAARALATRLQSPVLTDISIDWGDLDVSDVVPVAVPDLFAGHSVRVAGRYNRPGRYEIMVKGRVGQRDASLPLRIDLPGREEDAAGGKAVPILWARTAVADTMHQLVTPMNLRRESVGDDALIERVTRLGLDFALVTQWTSFVAVSERVYNTEVDSTRRVPVPLNQVKGVAPSAYPPSAAPEPAAFLGLLIAMLALGWFMRRPRGNVVA